MDILRRLDKQHLIIICFIMLITSIILRFPSADKINYLNSDATWHALLTIKSYQETPVSEHLFLPIVSLGHEHDKNISWGATIPDAFGNFYYTSFSPAGYIIPYFFISALNLPVNEQVLYIFNSILYLLCFLLAARFFISLFGGYINKHLVVLFVSLIYLFQPEILHSQGVVYWHQSLFQLLFLVQINLFINLNSKLNYCFFMLFCFILPYVEWTGFVSNAGFILAIFAGEYLPMKKLNIRQSKLFNVIIIVNLTVLSAVAFVVHYLCVVSLDDFIRAMSSRFLARSVNANVNFTTLLGGYATSFGILLAIVAILLFAVAISKESRKLFIKITIQHKGFVIIFIFCMVENVIMMRHAISYSFDRMKLIFILIFLALAAVASLTTSFSLIKKKIVPVFFAVFAIAGMINVWNYLKLDNHYRWNADYLQNNKAFANEINNLYPRENALIAQQTAVRGYANLLFNRGIYEGIPFITDGIKATARNNGQNYVILLFLNSRPWNMYEYTDYLVYDLQNEQVINNFDYLRYGIDPRSGISFASFYLTDSNWERGYSKHFTGFFIPNTEYYRTLYRVGCLIQIDSNDIREIIQIEEKGSYLWIYLSGDKFETSHLDFPASLGFSEH